MEVAGLVLGAVPLAVGALKCYKATRQIRDGFRNRRRHIEKLIRALEGHEAVLELNLIWLLKAVRAYEAHHTPSDIAGLIQGEETVKDIEFLLGASPSQAFLNAVQQGHEAVERIAKGIANFLPENEVQGSAFTLLTQKKSAAISIQFSKGVKFALTKTEIESEIAALDQAATIINQMQSAGASIDQMGRRFSSPSSSASSRESKKLTTSLSRVGEYANRLHGAIYVCWNNGCHSAHEAKLLLENRIEVTASRNRHRSNLDSSISFNLVFASLSIISTEQNWLCHESEVEVAKDEAESEQHVAEGAQSEHAPEHKTPRVTFSLPEAQQKPIQQSSAEVQNICLSIDVAKRERKSLRFYLHKQQNLRCEHITEREQSLMRKSTFSTISLKSILAAANGKSKRIPIKRRMDLALTLSSTLLQLKTTPWLSPLWTSERIHLMVDESGHNADFYHPIISRTFDQVGQNASSPAVLEPRQVILELGIMMLELWHEDTLESYFANSDYIVNDDYFYRKMLAERWLEASSEGILDSYLQAIAYCVRCNFDGTSFNPSWDSEELIRGIVQNVIEQLRALYKSRKS